MDTRKANELTPPTQFHKHKVVFTQGEEKTKLIGYVGYVETPAGKICLHILKTEWNEVINNPYNQEKNLTNGLGTVISWRGKYFYFTTSILNTLANRQLLTEEHLDRCTQYKLKVDTFTESTS